MVAKRNPSLSVILILTLVHAIAIYPLISFASPASSSTSSRYPSVIHPQPQDYYRVHEKRAEPDELEICNGFPGDQDTYGLGIRIGLYFQWITTSIAYSFVPSEAVTMRGVNNCFQAAMFAGLLFLTIAKGPNLFAVEAYLMLVFCMGGVCSPTVPNSGAGSDGESTTARRGLGIVYRGYAMIHASTLGGYFRLLLSVAFLSYGLWFTFVGMDGMMPPPNTRAGGCSVYAFFFAKVNLFGWFRTFLKVVFVFSCIVTFLGLVHGTFTLLLRSYRYIFEGGWQGLAKIDPDDASHIAGSTASQAPTGPPTHITSIEEQPGLHSSLDKGNVTFTGALILFILAVELTIRWNKISGVGDIGSTGQLLPVIIGIGGMGRVVTRFFQAVFEEIAMWRQRRRRRPVSTGANANDGNGVPLQQTDSNGVSANDGNGVPLQQIDSNATAVPPSNNPLLPFVHMNTGSHP